MSGDTDTFATARLPQEALENILVRLPASDLRRFRRVCKEWHDIISDPIFIKAHMVAGPKAPTHTIVFVPSYVQPTSNGFLFDEHWRLTARFTVGVSEVMIGTCKDSVARQYTIVHRGVSYNPGTVPQHHLKVFTVGADKDWRTMIIPPTAYSSDLACNSGAVCWSYDEYLDMIPMYARFDLATEEITSVERGLVDGRPIFCNHPWWQRGQPCVIRIRWLAGESDDGYWPRNKNATAFHTDGMNLPHGRRLPGPQALLQGRLLLQEANGALYAHKIVSRNIHELEVGYEKLLIEIGHAVKEEPAKSLPSGQFVRVHRRRQSRTQQVATGSSEGISAFAYVPTVSPAPLALHLGTPTIGAPALRVPPADMMRNLKQE